MMEIHPISYNSYFNVSSMNITNHPCPSFGKEGDAVQISYADT